MTSAMMLGYVRDGFTITHHLRANFKKNKSDARFGKPVLGRIIPGSVKGAKHEALRASRHRRGFPYPANSKPAPPIMLCHSWHDCMSEEE